MKEFYFGNFLYHKVLEKQIGAVNYLVANYINNLILSYYFYLYFLLGQQLINHLAAKYNLKIKYYFCLYFTSECFTINI